MNDRIDEVARQMTAGEPPDAVAFRRRVLARIDSGDAPRHAWRVSLVLIPIAAAAAIIVTLFVARDRSDRRPGPLGPGGMTAPMAQTPPPVPATDAAGPKGPARQTVETVTQPIRRPGPFGPGALEPNDVASIAIAPLAIDARPPESIQLEQLDPVAPITVAPLDINDTPRRNP